MVADEEKREIAAKMRAARYDFSVHNIALDIGLEGEYDEGYNARHRLAWLRLAHLIEPGEPKVKCVAEVKIEGDKLDEAVHRAMAEYAGVDRDGLLALADKMASFSRDSSCPSCAASGQPECSCGVECRESISHSAARRIREACGVVE